MVSDPLVRTGRAYVTRTHTRKVGAARPPTAADSGQGEGAQALKGRSARSLMTGGGRGCRPGGGGGGQQSSCQDRRGGVGWDGSLQNTNRSRSGQGTGGRRLVPLIFVAGTPESGPHLTC